MKNLTIYFSQSGNTEKVANLIHAQVGGDLKKIEPLKPYPTDYEPLANVAKTEKDTNARPDYQPLGLDPTSYDIIFVGYPMWWYTLPMIMYKFFDDYDFSGKTLIPFNTHEGSYDGGTWDTIKSWEPNATVLDGFAIRGGDANDASETIQAWLTSLGFRERNN